MIKFNIASINLCTETEGPFKRLTIWFQGCDIHCKGCCNPDYQQLISKNIISLEVLLKIIFDSKEKYDIEGVTYSGGEPTMQKNLSILTDEIHNMGLGVISFTGKNFEDVKEILGNCDMVLDGGFEINNIDNDRKILGSKNKRIINLSNRYSSNWFYQDKITVDVNIGEEIFFNGDYI